ncbi:MULTISPECIES: dipeptidase [Halolamina]|uniref:Membrane dipeptidase n=1 Tax=Halolamina pelagica TaxID=699431 RepID=A0A1I5WGR0_9EURY|nr:MULTISPECIES: membrane dipeptidase [Halolamina]NHX37970.1 peptidase M19 [Halolamina sp. R1-12]SFQ18768.1 membrane dipeptidase [Halolamina pelagica]
MEPVFDYSAGTPWIVNDAVEAVINEQLPEGSAGVVADAVADEQVRQFRTTESFRQRYREAFEAAGVNLPSVTLGSSSPERSYREGVFEDLHRWSARFDTADWLRKVTTPEQARVVAKSDRIGVILNTQNLGEAIEGDIDEVERLYNAGVRLMQLTYNSQNGVGTGCTDRSDGGLSDHGLNVIEKMNELGAVVDLSHCGTQTTIDGIEHSDAPVAVTHSSCETVYDHDRAKSDEELEALAAVDGYMGIVAVPFFLTEKADSYDFEVFFDHLEHAVSILGADRVGIGSDFGSIDADYPTALRDGMMEVLRSVGFREEHEVELGEGFDTMQRYEDWGVIREGLEERFTESEVRGILGENFLSFWDRVREA